MSEDEQDSHPQPLEQDASARSRAAAMVSPLPVGILSCVLSIGIAVAYLFLIFGFRQMSVEQKMVFVLSHYVGLFRIQGVAIAGVPAAAVLGFLSRHTLLGKVGLTVVGLITAAVVYIYLFGLPPAVSGMPAAPAHN